VRIFEIKNKMQKNGYVVSTGECNFIIGNFKQQNNALKDL
jgi:hypothetical protein